MAVKNRLQAEGRVVCHQGYIKGYEPMDQQVEVTYRPRGTTQENKLRVRHVLSCTGPQSDYRKLNDPLVKQLLVRDLLAPDPLRIGAYTAEGGYICNREGEVISGLYTLGSTQKGRLYESVAVPELRGQAADLAAHLLASGLLAASRSKIRQEPRRDAFAGINYAHFHLCAAAFDNTSTGRALLEDLWQSAGRLLLETD
jgi:uncharacterized NAD(P)/FAD-binding protein YdhS